MENDKPELIKHAAVISNTGMIFLGKSHADCFHQAFAVGVKMSSSAGMQGFFTNRGRFVSRTVAMTLAFQGNQVEASIDEHGVLFSEMLWSPTDGGKFTYDQIEGYSEAAGGKDE